MGSTVSTAMDENMKKNQAFMKETQQLQVGIANFLFFNQSIDQTINQRIYQ